MPRQITFSNEQIEQIGNRLKTELECRLRKRWSETVLTFRGIDKSPEKSTGYVWKIECVPGPFVRHVQVQRTRADMLAKIDPTLVDFQYPQQSIKQWATEKVPYVFSEGEHFTWIISKADLWRLQQASDFETGFLLMCNSVQEVLEFVISMWIQKEGVSE